MFKQIYVNGIIPMNCYVLYENDKAFIIDPGGDYDKIKTFIERNNLNVIGILLTHAHMDHTQLIGEFKAPIYLHYKEYDILKRSDLSLYDSFDLQMPYNIKKLEIKQLKDNDIIMLDDKEIKVIYTPGHTIGSVCYLYDNKLFSGDTLFYNSAGRTDLPTGNERLLGESLIKLIDNLDELIKVYPGHDEATTILEEKNNNYQYKYFKKIL